MPTAQQRREGITDVPKKIEPKSPVPKLVDPRPLTEEQAKNRLIVLKDMLRIKGGDPNSLTIVQHPSAATKYAIKSFDLPFKFDPDAYVRTFGKERTGRGEGPPTIIDPVEAYVNVARRTDTPAAKRFVRDWDAGRITRQDVEAALEAEKKGPIETTAKRPAGDQGPLTFTAAPEVKIAQQPIPGPTIETALAYKPRSYVS